MKLIESFEALECKGFFLRSEYVELSDGKGLNFPYILLQRLKAPRTGILFFLGSVLGKISLF